MNKGNLRTYCVAAFFLLIILALSCAKIVADVVTEHVTISTNDAPVITLTDHGPVGGNVLITRTLIGPAAGEKNDALYAFCVPRNPARGDPYATPILFTLDLSNGKFKEYFPVGKSFGKASQAPAMPTMEGDAPLPGEATKRPTIFAKGWEWAHPTCMIADPNRTVLIGSEDGFVLRFHPTQGKFEQVMRAGQRCDGLALEGQTIWALTAPGPKLFRMDVLGTEDHAVKNPGDPMAPLSNLVCDEQANLYFAIGPTPWQCFTAHWNNGKLETKKLLTNETISQITFEKNGSTSFCTLTNAAGETKYFLLNDGQATATPRAPAPLDRGYVLREDFEHEPPSVWIAKNGEAERHIEYNYSKATVDQIKTMVLSPDGKSVLGAAAPCNAWFSFPIEGKGRINRIGLSYSTYQMMSVGDRVYTVGYPLIKLLRWDPNAPWTEKFESELAFLSDPRLSREHTAWGMQGGNAEYIAHLRDLRAVNMRRPSGIAYGADGRIYCGGHDYAINNHWNETSISPSYPLGLVGALFWYDPATQSIGFEEPADRLFEQQYITDIASAAKGRYILLGTKLDRLPTVPVRDEMEAGYFLVFDTQTHKFVHQSSPAHARVRYVEEATDGLVVGYCSANHVTGEKGGQLFVFDTNTMQQTRLVNVPFLPQYSTYLSPVRFERGPDGCIYFYGTDSDGTALFRFDARSGKITAVAKGKGMTDETMYGVTGSTFLFAPERVFFGSNHLMSAPLEQIAGPAPKEGWAVRPSGWPVQSDSQIHHALPKAAVKAAQEKEEARVAAEAVVKNLPPGVSVAKLTPNVFQALPKLQWDRSDGPMWASLGHGNTVLCFWPGADEKEALLVMQEVMEFDEKTQAPRTAKMITKKSIPLTGPLITPVEQYLFVTGQTIRLCLIPHPQKGVGLDVEVIEEIVDETVSRSSRLMQPTAPSNESWYLREKIKAPWAGGNHVMGKISGAEGAELFQPAAAPLKKDRAPIKPDLEANMVQLKKQNNAGENLEEMESKEP